MSAKSEHFDTCTSRPISVCHGERTVKFIDLCVKMIESRPTHSGNCSDLCYNISEKERSDVGEEEAETASFNGRGHGRTKFLFGANKGMSDQLFGPVVDHEHTKQDFLFDGEDALFGGTEYIFLFGGEDVNRLFGAGRRKLFDGPLFGVRCSVAFRSVLTCYVEPDRPASLESSNQRKC